MIHHHQSFLGVSFIKFIKTQEKKKNHESSKNFKSSFIKIQKKCMLILFGCVLLSY